jgi:4-hydroxy-tetrahydrodipicolinate synthase
MIYTKEKRQKIINGLFPADIPRLWCPLLTHYRADGSIDFERMDAHFRHLVPWVKGFLIPGSTGDGWELNDDETLKVAEFAVQQAQKHETSLLLGVLKTDTETMLRTIAGMMRGIQKTPGGKQDANQILRGGRVCGFTVCPPQGSARTQEEIEAALSKILDLGMPIALYQLPQVTGNELAPETFAGLAQKYCNLAFFKDSSGLDRIAASDVDKAGVFLVRGAEGDYAKWLKSAGGPYDGFLLSTANCFPRALSDIIESLAGNDRKTAQAISEKLTHAVREVFALVQPLPSGNPFTNANKAMDHFYAFGPAACAKEGPVLHAKVRIPADIIAATGVILARHDLAPERGYLE